MSIFQYPLQPASEGYDKAEFLKVQVKPNNQEVQIDVALDFDSENYDAKAGENIALNTIKPGKGDQEEEGKLYPKYVCLLFCLFYLPFYLRLFTFCFNVVRLFSAITWTE